MNYAFLRSLPEYISRALVLLLCIPVHECAHGYIAYKLGDPTAKLRGRLTLNPLAHFDKFGCVCMVLFGVGWAKPVPVDPRHFKNPKKGMAITAAAGPISNLIMAFIAMILYKIVYYPYYVYGTRALYYISLLLFYFVTINVSLSIFNLMPVPPFDGSRIFGAVLPDRLYWRIMRYERVILIIVLILMVAGSFSGVLSSLSVAVFDGLDVLTRPIDKIMIKILTSRTLTGGTAV